jgi:hypothetical protein
VRIVDLGGERERTDQRAHASETINA